MRIIYIIGISVFLINCANSTTKRNRVNNKELNEKIKTIRSYYKLKNNDTIEFIRVTRDSLKTKIQEGIIFMNKKYYYLSTQKFTNTQVINKNDKFVLDSLTKIYINKQYREEFDTFRKVMFIQIQPDLKLKEEEQLKYLRTRQNIELQIEKILEDNKLGEWLASDLGPGGSNMLFFIDNWDRAYELVLKFIEAMRLKNNIIIAKRLYLNIQDWRYEIVYPLDKEGIFNDM